MFSDTYDFRKLYTHNYIARGCRSCTSRICTDYRRPFTLKLDTVKKIRITRLAPLIYILHIQTQWIVIKFRIVNRNNVAGSVVFPPGNYILLISVPCIIISINVGDTESDEPVDCNFCISYTQNRLLSVNNLRSTVG